jgi:hypothetical protein
MPFPRPERSRRSGLRTLAVVLASLVGIAGLLWLTNALGDGYQSKPGSGATAYGIADPTLLDEMPKLQAAQLSAMRSIGLTAVRIDADWSSVQPDNSAAYNWVKLDRAVTSIRAAGMTVDLIIDGCPRWAAAPGADGSQFAQPASARLFAAWAGHVAKRYAPRGVKYFEIWNEPNIVQFWHPRPDPQAYTADLVAAYTSIKKVAPSSFVISGGLAPAATNATDYSPLSFLRAMYSAGAKGRFDGLGDHPYSFPANPDKIEPWSAWSQMADTSPSLRSLMRAHGDGAKKIWITEYGAPSTGPFGVGQEAQRTELAQALAYIKGATWVGAFYIYTWQDVTSVAAVDYGFGLVTARGMPKPAYHAVAQALAVLRK